MVDQLVVSRRLQKLRQYVELLRQLRRESRSRFISDPFVHGNAERYLQLAIQTVLDIGNHIVADRKLKEPQEYRDIIRTLGQEGLLSNELAERLVPLVGLRNILVHDYLEIDREKLYDALHNELDDFEEFATHIAKLL